MSIVLNMEDIKQNEPTEQSSKKFKKDFPHFMLWNSLTRRSADQLFDNTSLTKTTRRFIIVNRRIAGVHVDPDTINPNDSLKDYSFIELSWKETKKVSNLSWHTMDQDGRMNANLVTSKLHHDYSHSFLTSDDKYLIVYNNSTQGYNVYSMEHDNWLLAKNDKNLTYSYTLGARSLLMNDSLVAMCGSAYLYFYYLDDNFEKVVLAKRHQINQSNRYSFAQHCMCLLSYTKKMKTKGENKIIHDMNILCFGGRYNDSFLESFVKSHVTISFTSSKSQERLSDDFDVVVKSTALKSDSIKLVNFDDEDDSLDFSKQPWYDFGYECILDAEKNVVVVIIGGRISQTSNEKALDNSRSVMIYNSGKNELTRYEQVRCHGLHNLVVFCFFC